MGTIIQHSEECGTGSYHKDQPTHTSEGKVILRLKPKYIKKFYCNVCKHQYESISMYKHINTKLHSENLIRFFGCLL